MNPFCKIFFKLFFFVNQLQFFYRFILGIDIFPCISTRCIFRCILNFCFRVLIHSLFHDTQFFFSYIVHNSVIIHYRSQSIASQKAISHSRKTQNHCKIIFLHSFQRNWKRMLGSQWNIFWRIGCRFPFWIRINTKHGEISRMTRPHPIIRFSSKFSDTLRWYSN